MGELLTVPRSNSIKKRYTSTPTIPALSCARYLALLQSSTPTIPALSFARRHFETCFDERPAKKQQERDLNTTKDAFHFSCRQSKGPASPQPPSTSDDYVIACDV